MKLKDKILMITQDSEGFIESGGFRLKDRIEKERVLIGQNESYRPLDNLLESRVLSNISSLRK